MRVRENVGMVFQHFHLFPHMTVLEKFDVCSDDGKGVSRETAVAKGKELLQKVGLAQKPTSSQVAYRAVKSSV